MLFEWLAREGGVIFSWWLLVTLAGLAVAPLALRLLSGLPGRGILLVRPLGLLLIAMLFWLLAMFGFVRNDVSGMALAYAVVAVIGLVAYFSGERINLRAILRSHRGAILVSEILFAVALIAWTVYKAYQNDAFTTEKPMELAFLSSIMRGSTFPPADPWFAGYSISYYYLGYVIAAMLSTLSGVSSGVGFSMIDALLFALVAYTVFSVVYSLVRSRSADRSEADTSGEEAGSLSRRPARSPTGRAPGSGVAIAAALLGTVFVVILSNFTLALVEVPYQTGTTQDYLSIWNMNERQQPQSFGEGHTGALDQWGNWWWFRAARAVSDRNLDGVHNEVIDEFPAFSFVLSDNHPHVLSLPFSAMTVGLALNIVLTRRRPNSRETFLYGLVVGGLIFLNTWDGAIYLIALAGAEALRRVIVGEDGRLTRQDWFSIAGFAGSLLAIGVIAMFPFLVSFRSQLAGILPNLLNPTMFNQFFLMFGPFLFLLLPFLLVEIWRARDRVNWSLGLAVGFGFLLLLALAMILFTAVGALIPGTSGSLNAIIDANGGTASTLIAILAKRLTHLPTALLLTLILSLVAARLFPRNDLESETVSQSDEPDDEPAPPVRRIISYPATTGFVLLLIALGAALALTPEFVYLRDNFGNRMNTVFKFYYQAWMVWGIASAYAVYSIFGDSRQGAPSPAVRAAYSGLLALVLVMGIPYIFMAGYSRAFIESGRIYNPNQPSVTLDGAQSYLSFGAISGDDMAALDCLSNLVQDNHAVVVQAVGDPYHGAFGTAATLKGIPVLFNWYGHEDQWRGSILPVLLGSRMSDIDLIYGDPTWNSTRAILQRYGVNYVFVGSAERNKYGDRLINAEYKLRDNLEMVCNYGSTQVYRVPDSVLAED